ncbi:MAG: 3-dehydroquinate dehydratase [Bacteroidia bacterium]|nr:3-dehydroquinate dehydratase [Bacteroidia bacterium]
MKKFGIINGPNLNLTGKREPEIYGNTTFDEYIEELKIKFNQTEIYYFQSNIEGEIINKIHEWGNTLDGIVINAGAYSHTSIAIADSVKAVKSKVIGVHISNIYQRETERHTDLLLGACIGNISGLGLDGYKLALEYLSGL